MTSAFVTHMDATSAPHAERIGALIMRIHLLTTTPPLTIKHMELANYLKPMILGLYSDLRYLHLASRWRARNGLKDTWPARGHLSSALSEGELWDIPPLTNEWWVDTVINLSDLEEEYSTYRELALDDEKYLNRRRSRP